MLRRGASALAALAISGTLSASPEPPRGLPTIPVDRGERDAPPLQVRDVDISLAGFVKLDVLFSRFSDGDVPSLDAGRDYFRPASIPVASDASAEIGHAYLDLHAKDTRFAFRMASAVAGHELTGHLELDFGSAPGGASEVTTNAYNARVRRAFLTYDAWLLGQEWSLLRNLAAVPDHIDHQNGPTGSLVIVRQPAVRYTLGAFQIALENAETNLQPRSGTSDGTAPASAAFVTGDADGPDLAARYNVSAGAGAYSVAIVLRRLSADDPATAGDVPNDGSAFGYGINVSGKLAAFGKDDLRFAVTGGDGVGRYVGLATIADAVADDDGGLEPLPACAAYVAYRHIWTDRWRSTGTVAGLVAEHPTELTGAGVTRAVYSGHANLLYTPVDQLLFGLELAHAVRELENGQDGSLSRLQVSTRYDF